MLDVVLRNWSRPVNELFYYTTNISLRYLRGASGFMETIGCKTVRFLACDGMVTIKKKEGSTAKAKHGLPQSAANQKRTRQEHAQELAHDYVEAIADLIQTCGEARTVDLAKTLGVTHVTVGRTVQRLQRDGLVTAHPYRSIFLTDAGRRLAAKAKDRHERVVAFLESLGVSSAIAQADAEGIEHHVSPETLAAFERCMTKLSRNH